MQCISPRNHMVFTPLLASTAVGTLEFRSIALPVRDIQSALAWPQNAMITADATSINTDEHELMCKSADGFSFAVQYDQLVIATGAAGSTFGIPGVEQNAHFLRDVAHASRIRAQIIRNLTLANTPGVPLATASRADPFRHTYAAAAQDAWCIHSVRALLAGWETGTCRSAVT